MNSQYYSPNFTLINKAETNIFPKRFEGTPWWQTFGRGKKNPQIPLNENIFLRN